MLGGGIDAGLRQTRKVGFIVDDEFVASVFLQKVVAELKAQGRELLVDLAQLGLLFGIQAGTMAHEVLMVFFHHTDLLVVKTHFVAVLIHVVDALEQFRVHHDGIAMLREHRQHLLGDGNHFVVGETFVEVEKHIADTVENLARLVVRQDGVFESWCFFIVDNGLDFSLLLLDACLKSRHIVLVLDLVERRHLERCRVFGEERIGFFDLGFLFRLRGA